MFMVFVSKQGLLLLPSVWTKCVKGSGRMQAGQALPHPLQTGLQERHNIRRPIGRKFSQVETCKYSILRSQGKTFLLVIN